MQEFLIDMLECPLCRMLHACHLAEEAVDIRELEPRLGEAGVLALARVLSATAVVDDRVARKVPKDSGIALRPTLALFCEAIRIELLTVKLVAALADELLATEYHLPFGPGGFEAWALENGMFEG